MSKHADTYEAWRIAPSPATAVALAAEDHKQGSMVDWPFVDELNKAHAMVQSHDQLADALDKLLQDVEDVAGSNYLNYRLLLSERAKPARAALALARKEI